MTRNRSSTISKGTVLKDRYRVITALNKGSYGTVYLAKDIKHRHRRCAIKCVTVTDEANHEIAIHKILGSQCKHISNVRQAFDVEGKSYLVMDYFSSGDLYEAISGGRGPRQTGNILEVMLSIIDAVQYAHSRGVYHRDIKPENILLKSNGNAVLADWGLATTEATCSDFGAGSERYMAPELFDKDHTDSYDPAKADIWAIGICLLNILFGKNPFKVASHMDRLYLDFATNREALFDIFPTLSNETFSVLRHCLTIDPDNRSLEKTREELLKVTCWTTDDLYFDLDEDEVAETVPREDTFESSDTQSDVEHLNLPTTTANRQPLKCPTGSKGSSPIVCGSKHFADSWTRKLQYTPKESRFAYYQDARMVAGHHGSTANSSRLSVVVSSEDVDTTPKITTVVSEGESSEGEDMLLDDSDIFQMDNDGDIVTQFKDFSLQEGTKSAGHPEVSARSNTDSSMLSNVPSLSLSSTDYSQSSTPSYAHPVYTGSTGAAAAVGKPAVVSRDPFKFGKSWGDMALDDDDDDIGDMLEFARSLPRHEIKQW